MRDGVGNLVLFVHALVEDKKFADEFFTRVEVGRFGIFKLLRVLWAENALTHKTAAEVFERIDKRFKDLYIDYAPVDDISAQAHKLLKRFFV